METIEALPQLITPSVMAARFEVPLRRVLDILANCPHIKPAALAGRTRVYSRESLAQVRHEVNARDARRSHQRHD